MSQSFANLCPGCFADKGKVSACPRCGYDENAHGSPLLLAQRSVLYHGQYVVGRVLGKPGGFGITYLGYDTRLETRVAIKEYLPRDLAGRESDHHTVSPHSDEDADLFRYGLQQFLQEARLLAKFDHANIVRVRNFFTEHGTGYLVMDYYEGITLGEYLSRQPQGRLDEKTAAAVLLPILDGLREVHGQGVLHRDIKPGNIYLTTGNRPILLDFGAARQAMGERSKSLSVVLSEGFSPPEQYHRKGEQGPWTDVYGCAAVLYRMVTGEKPPPAPERLMRDELVDPRKYGVSPEFAAILCQGLAVRQEERPRSMEDLSSLLLGKKTASPQPSPAVLAPCVPPAAVPSVSAIDIGAAVRRWGVIGLVLVALAGVGGGLAWKLKLDRLEAARVAAEHQREAVEQQREASERAAREAARQGYAANSSSSGAMAQSVPVSVEQTLRQIYAHTYLDDYTLQKTV